MCTTAKLIKLGYDVCIEAGAGIEAAYRDADYEAAGAKVVDAEAVFASDIVVCLDTPAAEKLALIKPGSTLICRMNPWGNADDIEKFKQMGITALAMDAVHPQTVPWRTIPSGLHAAY